MGVSDNMSKSNSGENDPKVKFLSIALAVVVALFWGFLIGGIWWFFNIKENVYEGSLLNWFARFHVIFLHLPIGLIFVVIALEVFGRVPGFGNIREATTFTLWLTLLGSIVATILGFLLMMVEEFAGKAMTLHMWTGLGVVVLATFALIFKLKHVGTMYGVFLVATALCITAAGHYGGSMVHEADYLSEYGPPQLKKVMLAGLSDPKAKSERPPEKVVPEPNKIPDTVAIPVEGTDPELGKVDPPAQTEKNVYYDYVHPILEKKCNECHNENKIKGKLRMDTHELLLAGAKGSDFPTVVPGNAEESEMIVRVELPSDEDDFMPPKGDPLTQEEIKLLKLWIAAGAKTETTVSQLGDDSEISALLASVEQVLAGEKEPEPVTVVEEIPEKVVESIWEGLSPEEQKERLDQAQTDADKLNISIMPISAVDPRLRISVLNGASEFGDEQIAVLEPVAENIVSLDLAKSIVTDAGLDVVGQMRNLEKLHLEGTKITDSGIGKLTNLQKLTYLNLHSTQVGNQIFEHIPKMPALRKVYVWQTNVDAVEARRYEDSVNIEINTGLDLEEAAAEAKAKREKEEKAAQEAKKKAEEEQKKKAEQAAAAKKKADEIARKKAEAEAAKKEAEEVRKKAEADAAAEKAQREAEAKAAREAEAKAAQEAEAAKTPESTVPE